MRTRLHSLAVTALAGLLLAGCAATVPGDVAATVDGVELSRAEVESAVRELAGDPSRIPADQRGPAVSQVQTSVLNRMIQAAIIVGVAVEQGLTVTDDDIAQTRADVVDIVGGEESLASLLGQQGLTPALFEDHLMPQEAAVRVLLRDLAGDGEIETRTIRHILVDTQAEADEIVALLAEGGDFAALAAERSTDVGSAMNGGELPPTRQGSYVPGFEEAAWSAEPGVVTGPVETQFGWHILEVVDIQRASTAELSTDQLSAEYGQQLDALLQDAIGRAEVQVAPGFGVWDPARGVVQTVVGDQPVAPLG